MSLNVKSTATVTKSQSETSVHEEKEKGDEGVQDDEKGEQK